MNIAQLSTPSLGITRQDRNRQRDRGASDFQLPLSGSREHGPLLCDRILLLSTPSLGITILIDLLRPFRPYKAFNSLSRDHSPTLNENSYCPYRYLSTPSLGITRLGKSEIWCTFTFNSLSRDHRARFRDFPALRGFLPRHLFAQMNLKTTI
jgi:hypothetical protein